MSAKKNSDIVKFSIGKKIMAFLISLVGLLFIIISDYKFKKPLPWWTIGGSSVCNSIGCTLMSAGIISLMLEISSIQNLIDQSLRNLLTGQMPLNHYTDEELHNLNQAIASKRLSKFLVNNDLNDTIYKYENNLIELSKLNYYEYHKSTTILTPDSSKGIFLKKVTIEYKLIIQEGKSYSGCFKWRIFSPKPNLSTEEIVDEYKLLELMVCEQNYKTELRNKIQIQSVSKNKYNSYDYIICLQLPEKTCREYTVKCVMEYPLPDFDVTQVYKMTKPCKLFTHEFHMEPDKNNRENWKISGNAFTAFYGSQDNSNANDSFTLEQSVDTNIRITFKGWILPGAGYVILAQPKR